MELPVASDAVEESKEDDHDSLNEEIESRYSDGIKEDVNVDAGETGTTNDLQEENKEEVKNTDSAPVESTADLIMRRAE